MREIEAHQVRKFVTIIKNNTMYLNKAQIIGNLTRDPEMKVLPNGTPVCNFSVATNHVYKDKNGVKQESVEFHNIVCFGKTAETVSQYMRKGSQVYLEGRIQTRSWEDRDTGKKMYRTEINADTIQFGNKPKDGASSDAPRKAKPRDEADEQWDDVTNGDTIEYPDEEINPDDIPF